MAVSPYGHAACGQKKIPIFKPRERQNIGIEIMSAKCNVLLC